MSTNMKPNDVTNYRRHHKDTMEVTSSRLFMASGGGQKPHPEGLLSPIIFGDTPQEKKERVGWINLGSKFLRPYAYKLIKRSFRAVDSIISGEKKYVVDEKTKELLEVEKGGGTGIKWLYDNWGKFKIKNLDTKDKDNVLLKNVKRYLSSDNKDEIFTSSLIVYPLAYRDINYLDGGHIAVDEINDCFRKILLYKETIVSTRDNALVDQNSLQYRLQLEMVTLMEETMKLLFYKNGLHNKRLRGKHVEFASRLIISANEFTGDKFGRSPVNIDTMGYPLSACAANFSLFIPREMQSILQSMYDQGMIMNKGKMPSKDDFEIDYDREVMQEWIKTYTKSWGERFNKVPVCGSNGKSFVKIKADIIDDDGNVTGTLEKDMTITELIYLATVRVIEEKKRVNIGSRYPIQDIYHVFPNGIHVLSTKDRMMIRMNGVDYNYFPDLSSIENNESLSEDPELFERKVSAFFEETAKISNLRLDDIGGDFDKLCHISLETERCRIYITSWKGLKPVCL